MQLDFLENDRGRFRIYRAGAPVGWVEGRTVGFEGFESPHDARGAARAGHDALRRWIARQRRTDAAPETRRPLEARRDGAATRLVLHGIPIGRLVEPGDARLGGAPSWGFELRLPESLAPWLGLSAARVIDAALGRRSAALGAGALATSG